MDRSSNAWIAALALLAFPGTAYADGGTSRPVGVSVRVPDFCQINASALVAATGDGTTSGTVEEVCNNSDGFQLFASYRPLAPNENVSINFAGHSKALARDGWSHIANRAGAKLGVRPIGLDYRGLQTPLAINLTVTQL